MARQRKPGLIWRVTKWMGISSPLVIVAMVLSYFGVDTSWFLGGEDPGVRKLIQAVGKVGRDDPGSGDNRSVDSRFVYGSTVQPADELPIPPPPVLPGVKSPAVAPPPNIKRVADRKGKNTDLPDLPPPTIRR